MWESSDRHHGLCSSTVIITVVVVCLLLLLLFLQCSVLWKNTNYDAKGGGYRACPWRCVGPTHGAARVCDRLEKQDKCSAASEANGFAQQTAPMMFRVREGGKEGG